METSPDNLKLIKRMVRINILILFSISVLIKLILLSIAYLEPNKVGEVKDIIDLEQIAILIELLLGGTLFTLTLGELSQWKQKPILLVGWVFLVNSFLLIASMSIYVEGFISSRVIKAVLKGLLMVGLYIWSVQFYRLLKKIIKILNFIE